MYLLPRMLETEFVYFVMNYHFYYTVNPNPKFIAKNIKSFCWAEDNKYKILKLKTRPFHLLIFLFDEKDDFHRSTSAHKVRLLKIQVHNLPFHTFL